ncbi:---NA--- : HEAT domain containing protein OS=Pseudanabaena biceps PCC 7429 GN=Pse7429DRAFT_2761 PE=4 SV=1: HEAT_2: HEAT_2 [Gemmataceae bacterium]|nr:---NA--- : HEAT domain containing protein OS=Pseudanabaena biceps PCC 7429 GN=Pse7429DRAFT_2761 PE=4 SV=1: HEAT_2: HEAT_2 [Gemmataceae bacterium]VTU00302.1 ---NA--- : HEAT domain containing protein OS=Pseudanabaena biceps PCC 7429 GN=Pse7429DRAFT_2761 PE=4 SV=1: HEAT_2: HEAT_2 [Gemmataceae bacterium]
MASVELPRAEMQAFLDAIRAAPDDRTARLAFADWLQDHDDPRAAWVRIDELWEWMAPDAADPTPRILAALLDPAHEQRHADLPYLLDDIGPAATPTLRAWLRESPDARFPLVYAYLEFARPPKLKPVRSLMKQIRTGTWYDVYEAIIDLRFHGPKAAPAVDLLLDLPKHDKWDEFANDYHRQNPFVSLLYHTFGAIGSAALKAVPELASNAWHCEAAFDALDKIKPDPILVIDHLNTDDYWEVLEGVGRAAALDQTKTRALVHAVKSHTGRVRHAAAEVLGDMGADAADAVPALVDVLLTNKEWDRETARGSIVHALQRIGEPARSALTVLRGALKTQGVLSDRKIEIGVALASLGVPAEGWAVIAEGLLALRPVVRATWLSAVAQVAAVCDEAVPYLFAALRDRLPALREAAAHQLNLLTIRGRLPEQRQLDWIEDLIEALREREPLIQWNIASALGQIGERNQPIENASSAATRAAVIDALLSLLQPPERKAKADDESVRFHAVVALEQWGKLPDRAATPLREYYAKHPGLNRGVQAIALIGPAPPG